MLDGKEIYSFDAVVKEFDVKRIGVSGAVFDVVKLDWLNQQYIIQNIPPEKLWDRIKDWSFNDEFMQKLIPLVHSRMKKFSDFIALSDFLFVDALPYTEQLFTIGKLSKLQLATLLQSIIWEMENNENWGRSGIHDASKKVCELFEVHHKKAVMPLLFSTIMGRRQGLPLFDSVELLGKDRTRVRLMRAIAFLGGLSAKKQTELKKAYEHGKIVELFNSFS